MVRIVVVRIPGYIYGDGRCSRSAPCRRGSGHAAAFSSPARVGLLASAAASSFPARASWPAAAAAATSAAPTATAAAAARFVYEHVLKLAAVFYRVFLRGLVLH